MNLSVTILNLTFCRKILPLLACCILLFLNVWALQPEDDNELWQELSLNKELNKKWSLSLSASSIYQAEKGNYEWYFEPKVKYHISDKLAIEGLYKQNYTIMNQGWTYENRPSLRFSYHTKFRKFDIKNRHRMELRMFEFSSSQFRYRSDIKIQPQLNLTKIKLRPYWKEELFVSKESISRIRSYLGLEWELGTLEPSLFFLIQSNKAVSSWNNKYILGLNLGVDL